ncbi:MAG: ATP-dependent helicase [Elainellaceae cyanobacterium]
MNLDLDLLNVNQKSAVLWQDGPLLVLAGPGSGKTRVLTYRVARMIQEQEDASVLALTFTNKAAAEMRERVDTLLGKRVDRAHLCTFHSFATEVLRQHGSHLGLRPDFTLLIQDEDRIAVLEEAISSLSETGHLIPTDRKSLMTLLDRLFAEAYDGGDKAQSLTKTPEWLPLLFRQYCESLILANRVDFGSLLAFTSQLLREKRGISRVLRLTWTHVCVDEFQDTNKAQYELLKLIVGSDSPNLFVVGDDDQIIYQWNGASPERLQSLVSDYDTKILQLPENYRCPPEIVELANKLISHNQQRTAGKTPLAAYRESVIGQNAIQYEVFETPEAETSFLVQTMQEQQLPSKDCVVLARTKKLLQNVAHGLQDAGLNTYLAKRKSDFESPVIRVVFEAMRLANARHDRDTLRKLCVAWKVLSDVQIEVENVVASAALIGGDFLRAWADAAEITAEGQLQALAQKLRTALIDRLDFPGIVDWFLEEGWQPWDDQNDIELQDEIETWQSLHGNFVSEYGHENLILNAYLQLMDLSPKTSEPASDAVRCLTVHGAKGLEFKHVFLIGMAQEIFPSFLALKKGAESREVEEERRNCFVAITRAKHSLILTRARRYYGWSKKPSQFLIEMGLEE